MLTDFQQKELWEKWLAAEIRSNYFADLCGRFQRSHNLLTWIALVSSSGAAAGFLTHFPDWLKAGLILIVAAISFYSIVQQSVKKVAECSDLSFRWNSLAIQYQELWNYAYSDEAESTFQTLLQKGADISRSGQTLPNDEKAMLKWEEHVLKHRIPNYGSPATA